MPKKNIQAKDIKLKAFLRDGGRKGAKADFNTILKLAVKPKVSGPKNKSK